MTSQATTVSGPFSLSDEAVREWRAGWPTVVAGMFGFMLLSLGMVTIQTFMGPIEAAFHWSRSAYSLGFTVITMPGFVLPPLVGVLVDRFGPRLVAVIGSLATGASLCLFAGLTGSVENWLLLWAIFGVSVQVLAQSLWFAAASAFFKVSRGLAIAVMMSGAGVAAMAGPVMGNALIEAYGFRVALVAMGLSWGGVTALVSLVGVPGRLSRTGDAAAEPASGLTVREGFRSGAFYKLGFLILSSYVAIIAVIIHMIALFTGAGLSRNEAVTATATYGGALLLGKFIAGFAMDAVGAQVVAAVSNLLLIACLAMLSAHAFSMPWALASAVLAGLGFAGFAPAYPYLATRHLGMRSFGRLFGVLACLYAIAAGVGPLIAGYVHDQTRSYSAFLFGCMPALGLTAALCLTLGRYPNLADSNG